MTSDGVGAVAVTWADLSAELGPLLQALVRARLGNDVEVVGSRLVSAAGHEIDQPVLMVGVRQA